MAAREYATVGDYFESIGEKASTPKEGTEEFDRILALIRAAAAPLAAGCLCLPSASATPSMTKAGNRYRPCA